jgi:hypothetical protein
MSGAPLGACRHHRGGIPEERDVDLRRVERVEGAFATRVVHRDEVELVEVRAPVPERVTAPQHEVLARGERLDDEGTGAHGGRVEGALRGWRVAAGRERGR